MTKIYFKVVSLVSTKTKSKVSKLRYRIDLFLLRTVVQIDSTHLYSIHSNSISAERVVSNYVDGYILFGKDSSSKLYWKSYPYRGIITGKNARLPKNVNKALKDTPFVIKYNSDFFEIIKNCEREKWTWINEPLIDIYQKLKKLGFTFSIGAYKNDTLVGGIWGLKVGGTLGIMSMFHSESSAGNILLGSLVKDLQNGSIKIIDCGVINNHFKRFGAIEVTKESFLKLTVRYLNSGGNIQNTN